MDELKDLECFFPCAGSLHACTALPICTVHVPMIIGRDYRDEYIHMYNILCTLSMN